MGSGEEVLMLKREAEPTKKENERLRQETASCINTAFRRGRELIIMTHERDLLRQRSETLRSCVEWLVLFYGRCLKN